MTATFILDLTMRAYRTAALLALLSIFSMAFSSCGSVSSVKTGCPEKSESTRTDTTASCPIYGDTGWNDVKLSDADAECQAFMSATDRYGMARLPLFCRCVSEEMSAEIGWDRYASDRGSSVRYAYGKVGRKCSERAEYLIPSESAGSLYTPDDYQGFMKECSASGSSREACRCLVKENSRTYRGSFQDSSERSRHECGIILKKEDGSGP
jgi:hypothetical protein